jgi:hypothetical protein
LLRAVEHPGESEVAVGLLEVVCVFVLVIDELICEILILVMPVLPFLFLVSLGPSSQSDASRALCDRETTSHDSSSACSRLLSLIQEFGKRLCLVEALLSIGALVADESLRNLAFRAVGIDHYLVLNLLQILVVLLVVRDHSRVEALELSLLLHQKLSDLFLQVGLREHLGGLLLLKVLNELHVKMLRDGIVDGLGLIVLDISEISKLLSLRQFLLGHCLGVCALTLRELLPSELLVVRIRLHPQDLALL